MRDKHTQPDDTRQGRWAGRLRRRLAHLPRPDLDAIRDRLPRRRRPPTPPPYPGDAFAAADIRVTDEIIAANPPRFGVNLDAPGYDPWTQGATVVNTYVADGGFEPVILRYKGVVAEGDEVSFVAATALNHDSRAHEQPPLDLEHGLGDGFFDGADARLYRVVGGQARLVRRDPVARYAVADDGAARVRFATAGPPAQSGDLYYLALTRAAIPAECLAPGVAASRVDAWRVYPPSGADSVRHQRDSAAVAPAHGSRGSLRVTIGGAVEGGVTQPVAGASRQDALNALIPGHTYRLEMWLRQEGIGDCQARAWLGPFRSPVGDSFQVDGAWRAYGFTFLAPSALRPDTIISLRITFRGPGCLWLDNVRLYDAALPPFAVRPEVAAALKAFRPDSLRIWSGFTKFHLGTSLENWLAEEGEGPAWWQRKRGLVGAANLHLPAALALARDAGARPWLIVHPAFDEAEWLGLMEYLAGPPNSPYGARRAAHGQVAPWTDVFDRISLEYGNEAWNAEYFPWNFDDSATFGAVAETFFGVVRSSPHYPVAADRFEFVVGGYRTSYGPLSFTAQAHLNCPTAETVGITGYVSAREPLPSRPHALDEMAQNMLLNPPWALRYYAEQQIATCNLLTKMGAPYRLGISEGGPRYEHPSSARPYDPPSERVGKSLAGGTAALDAALYYLSRGFTHQLYYALQPGPNWTSHTALWRGFRPHPSWLALQLRNQHATGDMVRVDLASAPTVDLPPLVSTVRSLRTPPRMGIPLVAAYAFKDGPRYSVFVLSRQLSIPTPVTLRLPARPVAATLYSLSGDPLATNLHRRRVTVRRRPVPGFSQDYRFTLPPASVYLFVVDTEATA
ncbi:MAG: hypothetical protein KIS91_09845 [Anaerolineae bacterium]|nr:hypothetical protein [Anaerolineae bacterium]